MLWTFGQFGYQDQFLMDMMHEIAQKLQADCNSKALADVMYAMARMGWADPRLHTLVAEYAMDNIQVCGFGCITRSGLLSVQLLYPVVLVLLAMKRCIYALLNTPSAAEGAAAGS
jgi:hypothetical protein